MQKGRDILRGFGPDSKSGSTSRASNGGQVTAKPLSYSPPKGPIGISSPKQGSIGGTNHGQCGTQGKH